MENQHLENADIVSVKKRDLARWAWLVGLVAFASMVIFMAIWAEAPKTRESPKALGASASTVPDPCGLADVECPGEATSKATTAQGPRQILRGVTITTYQAVAAQTDATPCTGAMAGVDFCNPPFPIVANNCLPLGTKVTFDFTFTMFTVADRMASRHDCDAFDILTDGTNYRLTNETAYVQ